MNASVTDWCFCVGGNENLSKANIFLHSKTAEKHGQLYSVTNYPYQDSTIKYHKSRTEHLYTFLESVFITPLCPGQNNYFLFSFCVFLRFVKNKGIIKCHISKSAYVLQKNCDIILQHFLLRQTSKFSLSAKTSHSLFMKSMWRYLQQPADELQQNCTKVENY